MPTLVLLVEDDNRLRKLIAIILTKAGHHVIQAANGEVAITLLQEATQSGRLYDVVLTDIVMGGGDGVTVTEFALQQPDAPEVILLTGHGSLETAVAALRHGAFDYLLKPVETSHLLERIAAAAERRTNRLAREREAAGLRQVAAILWHLEERGEIQLDSSEAPPSAPSTPPAPPDLLRYRQIGALRIDTHRHEVWFNAERVHLTPTEYAVVACLAETPGQVVQYEDIIHKTHRQVMPRDGAHALLTSHIRNIRRKIDQRYLVAVRSVGYMLIDPAEAEQQGEG